MKKKYFGTDGIRGTVNQGIINGEKFFKFGLAAGTYFKNLNFIRLISNQLIIATIYRQGRLFYSFHTRDLHY